MNLASTPWTIEFHSGVPVYKQIIHQVQAAIADGCARIRAAGIAAGILTADPDEAARYFESGFTFVAVGSDVGILARGAEKLAAQSKRFPAPSGSTK